MPEKKLSDLLKTAIEQEILSQKFYKRAMDFADDLRVRNFLRRLIGEEKNHEKILRGVSEMEIYDGSVPVSEEAVETAEKSHATDIPELTKDHTLRDIFEIALQREKMAYQNFMKMAKTSGNPELDKLFTSLAEDEQTHYKHIEQEYHITTGEMGYEG